MKVVSGRAVLAVALVIGVPLIWLGYQSDAKGAVPAAKCAITVDYPNIYGNGWLGYHSTVVCKNNDPASISVTFQILRDGKQWAVLRNTTSPVQFTKRCKRGGPVVIFLPVVSVKVRDVGSSKTRVFAKAGLPYHWRCLP
jgi:hypothetical protein